MGRRPIKNRSRGKRDPARLKKTSLGAAEQGDASANLRRRNRIASGLESLSRNRYTAPAVCAGLALLILIVYWPVGSHQFINYDDEIYVSVNEHVKDGLSWRGVGWAFTTFRAANWHPLTWLSHMLDCQLFGLYAGGHHLVNLGIHIANSILLYLVLKRMTSAGWRSAMVAALFALHPLHVQSVAWVAERKDVLCTLFGLLALGAYVRYTEQSSAVRYLTMLLLFAASLLAKPMFVTMPFLLLLLDYWPLDRLSVSDKTKKDSGFWQSAKPLVVEKIPMFVLAAASSVITLFAQAAGGAVVSVGRMPLLVRSGNAAQAYVEYLEKMMLPIGLVPFYQHPWHLLFWPSLAAMAFLTALTVVLLWAGRKRPYLTVGWLWYLGTLTPVIGLVQVGGQQMADRYTYWPLVGLFVLLVWGAAELAGYWGRRGTLLLVVLAGAVLATCSVMTSIQVRRWADSETLFRYTLEVTGGNPVVHNNLGIALVQNNKLAEAASHYQEALRLSPNYTEAHGNFGNLLVAENKLQEAAAQYLFVLRLNPKDFLAYQKLGDVLGRQGKFHEAEAEFCKAMQLDPSSANIRCDLAMSLQKQGKTDEALHWYEESLRLRPNQPDVLNHIAWIRATHPDAKFREGAEAVTLAQRCVALSQDEADYLETLAAAYAEAGRFQEAVATQQQVIAKALLTEKNAGIADRKERAAGYAASKPYRDPELTGPALTPKTEPQTER
jgi:protein O-mannosyl-transferase